MRTKTYKITAYNKDGKALYLRYVANLAHGIKVVMNHGWASHTHYIEYRNKCFSWERVLQLANRKKDKPRPSSKLAFICVLMAFLGIISINNVAMAYTTINKAIIAK